MNKHVHKKNTNCSCYCLGLEPGENCPKHGIPEVSPRCLGCGQLMKRRTLFCACLSCGTRLENPYDDCQCGKAKGFTLIELLIAMVILGILCMTTLSLGQIGNAGIKRALVANAILQASIAQAKLAAVQCSCQAPAAPALPAGHYSGDPCVHDQNGVQSHE